MLTLASLWLPILVSAVIVWVASFVVWAVLPHHRSDYRGFPDEESVREAMGKLPPGQYNIPNVASRGDLKNPEVGAAVWERFTKPRDKSLWYYEELAKTFATRLPGHPLAAELREIVDALRRE